MSTSHFRAKDCFTYLKHGIPVLALVGFCKLYTWLNITCMVFVKRLGCGCPNLDGSWRFNTNHLTWTILTIAAILTSICSYRNTRRLPEKSKPIYFICYGFSILMICIITNSRNVWL